MPPGSQRRVGMDGAPAALDDDDICRISDVTAHAWATSTAKTYGSGLLIYHIFCDIRQIPEDQRAPTSEIMVLAFVVALAGSYVRSAIINYVNGVRAWHTIHGLQWQIDETHLDAAIKGAGTLAPDSSHKKKHDPITVQWLTTLAAQFDCDKPLDAAVWACLTFGFFSLARAGELTVPNIDSFDATLHPSRANPSTRSHRGSEVRVLFLPRTKMARDGEDIMIARQSTSCGSRNVL
ncbi:uncharacterized protein TRAVEDRAFT_49334 [Trametes versicolor FP-101664 SS1]|uniref:uncharacterized protein n=1 Tax=Trametes versicolor (strain FP-101664) TaxID=717944 RepID=UPI00046216FB|nr:uncharacterized protein TRAVEDRAFT_49334 [Trametes versicolor FP-101664 SS1]EIW56507.1 hypothetical protein TRAVEDRAFT_49334 [Trametes versicolor FP-101664 SS1]